MFGRKKELEIKAAITGKLIPIEEVSDKVFSEKMVGDGVAIIPEEGTVVSPVDGTIKLLFSSLHAIGIETYKGVEILIHVGLDTVSLDGRGFEVFVKEGDKVKVGDKLLEVDIKLLKELNFDTTTPIVITDFNKYKKITKSSNTDVKKGEDVIFKLDF